ncbi:zinc finger protein 830 [Pistacia vera]|uniref:zinc finger protein 830 n=1 Tax=Pistacia vera TaxID=55513 RepID=UPI001263478A|nr:zinc finger protein 830 [Pistacia vera]XP_031251652.1 zinc finger protein 830 [Pistacia vera]
MDDAQAKKKALFRAKLNAQKKEKRINSPLVRYNEVDQPVCRVCDVVLKSESQWDAHQASRKHHQAISNLKASATGVTQASNAKSEPSNALSKTEHRLESQNSELQPSKKVAEAQTPKQLPKAQPSSVLPSDFFDNEAKKPKTDSVKMVDPDSSRNSGGSAKTQATARLYSENKMDGLPISNATQTKKVQSARELSEKSTKMADSESKQPQGALPEGFFDNKEADLRARGINPVKPDVKDEYKEFEKLIQEDLQEVDNRMEEDEFDAAETIQEYELLEQKAYKEKVEALKKRKMELEAAKSAKRSKSSEFAQNKSTDDEASSDDEDEDEKNFAIDWRAQHL